MDLNKDLKDIHININSSTFNILYRKYKSFLIPISIIIVCIILFFIIIVPQIQNLISAKDQEQAEKIKLEKLRKNYNLLSSMSETELNANLEVLSKVLSPNKDFAGVINAISSKSSKTGVSLGDFDFSVGDISTPSQGLLGFPSLQIELSLSGSPKAVLNFINEIYKSAPISEITTMSQSGNTATIKLQFYYKSFPQGSISDEALITQFSSEDLALIDKMSTWENNVSDSLIPIDTALQDSPSSPSAFINQDNSSTPF